MFQAVSPPIIRSSKTVHTASGICQACLLLLLAVAAKKMYRRTMELANISSLSPDAVQFATPVPLRRMADVIIKRV